VKKYGFNVLFDAIGGGDISDKLISNLSSGGQSFIYGTLSKDPLIISKPLLFTGGAVVTSWMFSGWLSTLSKEEVDVIRKNLPVLLKN
jgi:NADPH:quinone reductase-like Zn-dependent oxidoreductase